MSAALRRRVSQRRGFAPGLSSLVLAILALLAPPPECSADAPAPWQPEEGRELIGTPAPEWRDLEWLQGGPLTLEDLRGRTVLLRFWLVGCPYCRASAPALVGLEQEYRDRGLVVVGIHHPKSEAAKDPETVRRAAESYGFEFPIALDDDWSTIRAYGVGSVFTRFTSVSFLIGPDGVIRWVHDGGAYVPGPGDEGRAYDALVEAIERWLPAE
jgi:thiol-disulfide isomerase/thioredoxin